MTGKHLILGLAVLVLVGVGAVFLDPTCVVWGYLKGEPFYHNRPVTYWHKTLKDQDPKVQEATFRTFKEGGAAGVPILVALLKEKTASGKDDPSVRLQAVTLLKELGPEARDAVPALVEALKDDDLHVRTVAAATLEPLAPKEATTEVIPNLMALLPAHDAASAAAARTLSRFGPEARPAIPALLEMLKAKDARVRLNAARTLGKIKADAVGAVPDLITMALKDEDPKAREHAAEALGDIGPAASEGVPALIEVVMKDKVARVRRDAARSLGQIGPPAALPAVPALKGLLKDEDKEVREFAAKALRLLGADGTE